MTDNDPFTTTGEALSVLVKQFERRWGLTIASFLPAAAQQLCARLQETIARRLDAEGDCLFNPYVEFYSPAYLHCTHLTLRRSDPRGPVKLRDFLRPGHDLGEVCACLCKAARRVPPFEVELGSLHVGYDRLALVLWGECADRASIAARRCLLEILNDGLSECCVLGRRAWDSKASKFHQLHACLGYLKRPLSAGYAATVESILGCRFEPMRFELTDFSILHHRRRSLAAPQEGRFDFRLGGEVTANARELAAGLRLAGEPEPENDTGAPPLID